MWLSLRMNVRVRNWRTILARLVMFPIRTTQEFSGKGSTLRAAPWSACAKHRFGGKLWGAEP
jgi:hypothetical protein